MTANEAGKMTESAVKTHSADALNRFIDRRIGEAARAGADYIRDAGAYPSSTSATLHDFPLDSLMGQFMKIRYSEQGFAIESCPDGTWSISWRHMVSGTPVTGGHRSKNS